MSRQLVQRIGAREIPWVAQATGGQDSLDHHLLGALSWIARAHAVSKDGGVSKGYHILRRCWFPSYPETTGYTIPTLLNAATVLGQPHLRGLARSLSEYLLSAVTSEGGIVHWRSRRRPIVFDTGQAMFGWLAAFDAFGDARYRDAAVQAGEWLVSVQGSSGAWERYQYLDVTKVIDTRVAWALLELSRRTGQSSVYRTAAERNVAWAVTQQEKNGWFRRCAFREGEDPFTHTLAYAAEGLLEAGVLLAETQYVEIARRTADALLVRQRADGSLASTYDSAWRPTSRSSCLTGNCQSSRLWLRLYEQHQHEAYLTAARRAIGFVAGTQNLDDARPNLYGGIAGSNPIHGRYERFKYPNWASKFFVDALLALKRLESRSDTPVYAG